ncbi:MAG: DUF4339 domain-containing protein [Thermoguttaceae bacterium]|jgi:hypothetical protein
MATLWYYGRGGQSLGPVSSAQLKDLADRGNLAPADLVWKDGMAEWVAAKSIKGLFPEGTADGPPPTPATTSITPTGPADRQPSYAMQAGRTIGKLNRGVLWLAGIGGILALILIGFVVLQQIPGFAAARFDLYNLETTKRWALQQYLGLLRLRREGNTMHVAEATRELECLLQANEGKTVRWRVAVAGVTNGTVFLQSSYSERVKELQYNPGGDAAGYMAIGCEEDLGVGSTGTSGWMGSMLNTPIGVPTFINGMPCRVTKVQIGRHIAPASAAKLKNGDYVTVQAIVGKTEVSFDSILIRLDNVAVSE